MEILHGVSLKEQLPHKASSTLYTVILSYHSIRFLLGIIIRYLDPRGCYRHPNDMLTVFAAHFVHRARRDRTLHRSLAASSHSDLLLGLCLQFLRCPRI